MKIISFNYEEKGRVFAARRLDSYARLTRAERNLLTDAEAGCECGTELCVDGTVYRCERISPADTKCTLWKTTKTCN